MAKKVKQKVKRDKKKVSEDLRFARLINKGMKSGNIPLSELRKKLSK